MNKVRSKRLGNLITFKRGYDLPEHSRTPGPYPVISSAGISGYHNEYKVEGKGVVTGRYGTLGEMYFVDGKYWPHNTALYVQNFKGNDPKYIYYLLSCLGRIRTSDKSAVPGVNRNELHEMFVPAIEDKTTQIAIRKVLEALDAKIELNNRINAELEAIAKTVFDYWFIQFDFPFDFAQDKPAANGKPYKSSGGKMVYSPTLKRQIPVGWEAKSLAAITPVSNESLNPAAFPEKQFRHFSIPAFDTTKTYAIESGDSIGSNKFVIEGTDLLVSKLNPWFNRVIYAMHEEDQICSTEFVVWRCSNSAIKNYLYLIATSPQFISHCTQSATGTSNSHKRVNPNVMMRFEVPFKYEIAENFGEKIEPILKQSIVNQKESTKLAELRDWLLPMLMNGQIMVNR